MEDVGREGPSISVLIVDDHRMVAEALRLRLSTAETSRGRFHPVQTAYSLPMARAALAAHVPDLVLLDHRLGEVSGMELVADLEALPDPPCTLIVAAGGEPADVVEGLTHAAGWVSKGTSSSELLAAIEAVLDGRAYVAPRLLRGVLDQLLLESGRRAGPTTFIDGLSARELQVLRCLVDGMTRQEIAAHLFISPNTVRTHVQNLLRAAGVHSSLSLIAAAREQGLTGSTNETDDRSSH